MTDNLFYHHLEQVDAAREEWKTIWPAIRKELPGMSKQAYAMAEILEWREWLAKRIPEIGC